MITKFYSSLKLSLICLAVFCSSSLLQAQIITTVAGNGTASYGGDGGQAIVAQLQRPTSVAFDAGGSLYIADRWNACVRKVTTTGVISTVAGTAGVYGNSGDGGQATLALLNDPSSIAIDAADNLYIGDGGSGVVRKVNPAGVISTIAGNGGMGYSGDGGPALAASFYFLMGIALDATGNLYIADMQNNRIRKVDIVTGIISTVAGTGTYGYGGDGSQATSAFLSAPTSLAFDRAGNMYIYDGGNDFIRRVNTAGIIESVAGIVGASGYSGDGGPATAAQLELLINGPSGLVCDNNGSIYFTDGGNHAVRKIDAAGIISTIAGKGTDGYSGDGGLAKAAQLNSPAGICLDAAGNLYVADMMNQRIRKITNVTQQICNVVVAGTINSSAGNTLCAPDSTILSLNAATTTNVTYQWQMSTDSVFWANVGTDSTAYLTGVINHSAYYKCIVQCISGTVMDTTPVYQLTVDTFVQPSVIVVAAPGVTISAGQSVTFVANTINGGDAPTYQWRKNSAGIPGATNNTFTTSSLAEGDKIDVTLHSSLLCASAETVNSNSLTIHINTSVAHINEEQHGIELYPNPNNGILNINGSFINDKAVKAEVLNMLGQLVYSKELPVTDHYLAYKIALPNAGAGLYILCVTTESSKQIMQFSIYK